MLYYWLSGDPPILRYTPLQHDDLSAALPESRVYRLPVYYWHASADDVERYHLDAKAVRPRHVFHHLINERDVHLELVARGLPSTFCSHNAFLDERIFTIQDDGVKRYDAVYNARMSPFKRHELARLVPRLLVIGGVHADGDSRAYFEQVRATLPGAHFLHTAEDRWFPPSRIALELNQARVGLCLSAVEGAMYAATEYLLCGLPVVSTASLGGRDEWFDPKYVRVVADDPDAVAAAIRELIALDLAPRWIRQQTLRKVWAHRRRLVELVQDILDCELACRDFAREWYPRLFHKMGHWRDPREVMHFVDRDCPPLDPLPG